MREVTRPDEAPLSDFEIAARLAAVPEWQRHGGTMERTYLRRGFTDAVVLISRIAALAEARDHHPDLHLERYRRLRVALTTHACGGLSAADFDLARAIDEAALP
ncbi:MAG: 4a-hydroxytetrahydrobiopterin dehydratase [Chloroflexi bacterium]|nr:4a-hydroxytetrahydrobiopterin dehydratase [Chloroflexota bacterium]